MGNYLSCSNTKSPPCNFNCKICRQSKNEPNPAGKFILLKDNKSVRCTGCNTLCLEEDLKSIYITEVVCMKK